MRRYVLHPGYVTSKSDGQSHYITAPMLRHLYGVPRDAKVINAEGVDFKFGFRDEPGDVHLYPRSSGKYQLPPERGAS